MQEPLSTQAKPVYANFSVYKGKAALSLRVHSASVLGSITVPTEAIVYGKHAKEFSSRAEYHRLVTTESQGSGGVLQLQDSCRWVFCTAVCHLSHAAGAQAALDRDGRGRLQPGKVGKHSLLSSALACASAMNPLPHAFSAGCQRLQYSNPCKMVFFFQ